MKTQLGREIGARQDQRQAYAGVEGKAVADGVAGVGAAGGDDGDAAARELDELAVQAEIYAADVLARRIQRELRQPVVRRDYRVGRILQGLEALRPCGRGPPAAAVDQHAVARQRGLRSDVDAARQVAEIIVVGNLVDIEGAGQLAAESLIVLEGNGIAVDVCHAIVGQFLDPGVAIVAAIEIAELPGQLQTAFGKFARHDGEIAVGREVDIERRADFQPALAAAAYGRREEAGLALVVQRKIRPGQVGDRHALEHQLAPARHAQVARHVHVQVAHLHDTNRCCPVCRWSASRSSGDTCPCLRA